MSFSSPRKQFANSMIHSANNCSVSVSDMINDPSQWNWTYHGLPDDENVTQYCTSNGCVDAYCGTHDAFGRYIGTVVLLDTRREEKMGYVCCSNYHENRITGTFGFVFAVLGENGRCHLLKKASAM